MKKFIKDNLRVIISCSLLLIGLVIVTTTSPLTTDTSAQLQDGSLIIETQPIKDFNSSINSDTIYKEYLSTIEQAESMIKTNTEIVQNITEKQILVSTELNALKNGNDAVVKKYFGESETFTTELVADRVAPAEIHFITNPESSDVLYAHVCTLDYQKIVKDYIEKSEESIASGILNGDYDICYTVTITIQDEQVLVNEALKEALTGGWYQSDTEPTNCILG